MLYSQSGEPAVPLFPFPVICRGILSAPNLEEIHTSRFFCFLFCSLNFSYSSAAFEMTRILTACKVVKTLKGRLKFCNVSADHWSFSRTGTRLLSTKVIMTEYCLIDVFGMQR